MKIRHIYLALAILGAILTYSQLIPFMEINGADMVLLFKELFRNEATSFFGFDLLITALVALIFIIADGKKTKLPYLWIPVASIFLIGVAFGFPLYLYMKDKHLDKNR